MGDTAELPELPMRGIWFGIEPGSHRVTRSAPVKGKESGFYTYEFARAWCEDPGLISVFVPSEHVDRFTEMIKR